MKKCGQYAQPLSDPDEVELWSKILENQNKPFMTSGRGSRPGIQFAYTISTNADGSPGAEMFVSTRTKSITRRTIMLAFHKVKEVKGKVITGPKAIGVHGDSYIYAIFKALGIINTNQIKMEGLDNAEVL